MTQDISDNEKRHFTRIPFDATVQIENPASSLQRKLIDISLKGMLVKRPDDWQVTVGDHFQVTLKLNESDAVINMEVKASHVEKDHVGFTCEHIGIDSITHLRRLVELNLGDSELLNRELSELIAHRSMSADTK